jgi:hypothetical protein
MKKVKIVEKTIFYCDICGEQIVGNMVTFDSGTEIETHTCLDWNDSLNHTCCREMEIQRQTGMRKDKCPTNV